MLFRSTLVERFLKKILDKYSEYGLYAPTRDNNKFNCNNSQNFLFVIIKSHKNNQTEKDNNHIYKKNAYRTKSISVSCIKRRLPTLPQYAVPSALSGLTSLFGMGRGVSLML